MRSAPRSVTWHWVAVSTTPAAVVALAVLAVACYGGAPVGRARPAAAAARPAAATARPAAAAAAATAGAARLAKARLAVGQPRPAVRATTVPIPVSTVLATVRSSSPRYATPGVRTAGAVPATWWGMQSVLPVVATRPGWVEVRLAQRPDGSTAWLPATDVTLSSTGYFITINLTTMHLTLYLDGRRVFSAPAGVGTVTDPTPTGHFFVAFTEPPPQPNPGYGPFILVTSAHSGAISDWGDSGDAVIGIHGPLGEDSLIGTAGARISHGCVRLHLSALAELRYVPPGTPIGIFG